jgi:N6-L-threonylcarbamoyladenine synthase
LGLPYPGGPSIQKAADGGDPKAFAFPRARLDGTWDFSFSGLKTAVLRVVRQLEGSRQPLPVSDLASSFQAAVVEVLFTKTIKAAQKFGVHTIVVAGGYPPTVPCAYFFHQKQFPYTSRNSACAPTMPP